MVWLVALGSVVSSEIKERNKKTTDEKKAKKAEVQAKQAKGAAPKGAAGPRRGAGTGSQDGWRRQENRERCATLLYVTML